MDELKEAAWMPDDVLLELKSRATLFDVPDCDTDFLREFARLAILEVMSKTNKLWLVTGDRIFHDAVFAFECEADKLIAKRGNGSSQKYLLYAMKVPASEEE